MMPDPSWRGDPRGPMNQAKYHAKKALLKRVVEEWRKRMRNYPPGHPRYWPNPSRLSYSELVDYYQAAHAKSRRFRGLE